MDARNKLAVPPNGHGNGQNGVARNGTDVLSELQPAPSSSVQKVVEQYLPGLLLELKHVFADPNLIAQIYSGSDMTARKAIAGAIRTMGQQLENLIELLSPPGSQGGVAVLPLEEVTALTTEIDRLRHAAVSFEELECRNRARETSWHEALTSLTTKVADTVSHVARTELGEVSTRQAACDLRERELDERERNLASREAALIPLEEALSLRSAELDLREAGIRGAEERCTSLDSALQKRTEVLDNRQSQLERRSIQIDGLMADLGAAFVERLIKITERNAEMLQKATSMPVGTAGVR